MGIITKDARKEIRLYVPENLDIAKALGRLGKWSEPALWLVHLIYQRRIFDRRDPDGWVYLRADYLRCVLPKRQATGIRDALVSAGIIEVNHSYCPDRHSKGYRLVPRYRHARHRRHVIQCEKTAERIRATRQKIASEGPTLLPVHQHLRAKLEELGVTYSAAAAFVASCGESDVKKDLMLARLQALRDGDTEFKLDEFGRVHTNLTNLNGVLRPFLRVNGSALVNIDIRNSQPLFLGILLANRAVHGGNLESIWKWDGRPKKTQYEEEEPPPHPHTPPYVGTFHHLRSPYNMGWDRHHFLSVCEEGRFYELMMAEMKVPPDQRSEFKAACFGRIFFDRIDRVYAETKTFRRLFPRVYADICEIKDRDYCALSHLLQRQESSLVINKICRRIMHERPDAWIGTIHDSILTTPDQAEYVIQVLKNAFAEFRVTPSLRVESYASKLSAVA